jgi:hypothetical protein
VKAVYTIPCRDVCPDRFVVDIASLGTLEGDSVTRASVEFNRGWKHSYDAVTR